LILPTHSSGVAVYRNHLDGKVCTLAPLEAEGQSR
jgi:hypothetical protein